MFNPALLGTGRAFPRPALYRPTDQVRRPTDFALPPSLTGFPNEQEGRQVANPYPFQAPELPSPWIQREQDAYGQYQGALGKLGQIPAYEPPPSIMAPKMNLEAMLALALVGLADPTKTVVPEFAGGYLQGGRMASENEAQRRKAAIEAAQQQAGIEAQMAEGDWRRASGMLEGEQRRAHEMEVLRQRGDQTLEQIEARKNVEVVKGLMRKIPPEARAHIASQYGIAGAQAFSELTEEEKLTQARTVTEGARANRINTLLPVETDYMKAGTKQREAGAALSTERATDLKETRQARIDKLIAEGQGKVAHTEYEKSLTELKKIEARYAGPKHQADIAAKQASAKAALARANNSLASAAKTRQISQGKGMTDVQFRYFDKQLKQAESALGDLESSAAYLDERASFYQSQVNSSDPATAQAAQQALGEIGAQRAYLNNKIQRAKKLVTELRGGQAPPNAQGGKIQVPGFLPFSKEINRRLGSFNPVNPVPPR